ncbi:uncharacterized protein LOC107763825 [Nicotiana tabacum]|uniref:Uncharacterized protein n=1 Tax=Nicotiana tabacum TaxID=4097 RepID=A0A1S3XD05_TOBAC|nr:PREDICTED: uncharacterized protein LOC107763825 [Nicotiana tabacum]XP_016437810.1 PREDICTED: uncharacterized protein LOC107763825 [Nicotiana tabacum]XP_016437811.1 PREDICTED: uncharacterized protein LOC107763825 [Nicotiana tabacum]XP_016437812.1 PREDICTED: uncharacterized protein LOC107763825 [Nicotiana tabacum]
MENRPIDVPDSQFRELLRYWNSDTYKEKKKETSESLSSKDIFVATRKRKPDQVYKASYADTLNKIAEMDRIQSTQETEDDSQSVDAFASIMGPEHPGRLILYGRGVTKTSLKTKVGDIGTSLSSIDEMLQQKMVEMEERMQQRMWEKFNAQKDAMELQVAVNIISQLKRLNPDLQVDPNILVFNARSPGDVFPAQ